ncbi:hypothetical protein UPYG_G00066040 [Umbra pygmaea]|uniref:RING-type domain-containing protein n=1 Tax=Umbra pygmaea TaxID=75934 RepID=A0ABD0XAN7_UMBPY
MTSPKVSLCTLSHTYSTFAFDSVGNMASNDEVDNLLFEELLKNIGKHLECVICFQIFTDPVTLLCGHSYCMKCLDSYLSKKAEKNCPECRGIIRQSSKCHKNVTLCNIVKVHADHKSLLSKECSIEKETKVLKHGDAEVYATVDLHETDINRPEYVSTTQQPQERVLDRPTAGLPSLSPIGPYISGTSLGSPGLSYLIWLTLSLFKLCILRNLSPCDLFYIVLG